LDTPGLLWPNLSKNQAGLKLALARNINQDILDVEELACEGITFFTESKKYHKLLLEKYQLGDECLEEMPYDILEKIGRKRGCLVSGGSVDMTKASKIFLEELKNGKIGKLNFEFAE